MTEKLFSLTKGFYTNPVRRLRRPSVPAWMGENEIVEESIPHGHIVQILIY